MKKQLLLFVFLACALPMQGGVLRGVVRDSAGRPLSGVSISVGRTAVLTGDSGSFELELPDGAHIVRASRSGLATVAVRAISPGAADFELRPEFTESIVVSGIRAADDAPATKSDLSREDIEARYHQQDIPLLLRDLPSVTAFAESGVGGSGYSYISLRGIGSSRINFTLDGVPLADSEDMATYFADFPDLARSLQSIQMQRGVGTSTVGSASFGGSVNLESIDLAAERQLDARVAAGSFGSRSASVGYQSGWSPGGLAFYSRLSLGESDGYRDHSGAEVHNLFVSIAKQNERSQLKLTGFSAHEKQQMSFLASDPDTLARNRRDNPLAPEERDSFGYDLAQLQYIRPLGERTTLTASAYYQRGYGWYRLFDDNIARTGLRQYGLDGQLLGSMVTTNWSNGPASATVGLHVNRFRREHTRDEVGAPARDYANAGVKREVNAFAKGALDRGPWHFYADAQVRSTDFSYEGDVTIEPHRWTFFSPRVGARLALGGRASAYASIGASAREPARADFFQGEDNPTIAHDLRLVRPERVRDFELGWERSGPRGNLLVNVYAMEFRDEIAPTGELSEIGLPLRRNVDRSHRRGVEVEAAWRISPRVRLQATANASSNGIDTWTQSYDVYDDAGEYLESRLLTHRDVEPLLTPSLIASQSLDWSVTGAVDASVVARFVSAAWLDNTNDARLKTPAALTADATIRWSMTPQLQFTLQANNITNQDVRPSGYSYLTMTSRGEVGGTPYYYAQAGRNFVLMLDFKYR